MLPQTAKLLFAIAKEAATGAAASDEEKAQAPVAEAGVTPAAAAEEEVAKATAEEAAAAAVTTTIACNKLDSAATMRRQTKLRKKKKSDDVVKINVGGTIFIASKTTLASSSSYFASKFKTEWDDDDDDDSEPPYIDKNPAPFAILLEFMRDGFIEQTQLTKGVLVQAAFFGMDDLLTAIKAVAFRAMKPEERHLQDDEASQRFDAEFGEILSAIHHGILPKAIKKSGQLTEEQYAVLYAHPHLVELTQEEMCGEPTCAYITIIVRSNTLNRGAAGGNEVVVVPTCSTLVDALNWLSREGFYRYEGNRENILLEDFMHLIEDEYGADEEMLQKFARKIARGRSPIIFDNDHSSFSDTLSEKSIAWVFRASFFRDNEKWIVLTSTPDSQTDVPVRLGIEIPEEALTTTGTTHKEFSSKGEALAWIKSLGYLHEEEELSSWHFDAVCDGEGPDYEFFWSRPLE